MMVLMFQREVAERIVRARTRRLMGGSRCLPTWRTEPRILFDISPGGVRAATEGHLFRGAAGSTRRAGAVRPPCAGTGGGRLRAAPQNAAPEPKSLSVDPARLAVAAQVDASRRAETIPVSGFVAMARELTHIRHTNSNVT
jgi:16S rRNA (adenine1518-N6/adenine1519-N6)-dimethyltransferase